MEKEQRSRLQKATQEARRLLEEEFSMQLLETYDINVAAGRWSEEPGAHLQAEQRLLREKLLAWIEHRSVQINDEKEALLLALREMAFTALNRFVALKLMEARELVRPCVSGGLESEGFQEFTAVAQGLLVEQESSYRLYLETIFEDVSRELRALFDPRDPASLLWPKRTALLELLDILNRPELAELWKEDETLGWIYQYFNGDAERKKMREESSAPRNSRELAVRNQFFTPRYVVEFLTDNTLGRIWYEMRQGDTGLKERCRYLVRRPNEIWLQSGEEPPAEVVADEALSQEELLRQAMHIPYRPLKDPREIRMLDPACGSMHFGLYAFDLYLAIYEEAWEIAKGSDEQAKQGEVFAPFVTYAADFASKAAFLREVPRLILLHNIHGIDIDPRATQIARLTLWLRAQRDWQEQGVEVAARPAITRSNVVCAEPMPGERELLADFVDQEFPEAERGLVQQLLETIFDKMQLAGEAGSLLKIDEEIRDAIDQARREWQMLAIQQRDLFSTVELAALGGVGSALNTDLQNLTKDFWVDIEERIYTALSNYSEQAERGGGFQRRLFAEDAAQGFAFIDVCRKRYDVALMNPPFGSCSVSWSDQAKAGYPLSSSDLFASFIERGTQLLEDKALLGAITPRSGFFLTTFQGWREDLLLKTCPPIVMADLGFGIMDGALVEASAYCLQKQAKKPHAIQGVYLRILEETINKKNVLRSLISHELKESCTQRYICSSKSFSSIPGSPFAYWLSPGLRHAFTDFPRVEDEGRTIKVGDHPGDGFRYLRLWWEIPIQFTGIEWPPYQKGGAYSPFYADIHLVANWDFNRQTYKGFIGRPGRASQRPSNFEHFFRPGLTWTRRTKRDLSMRILPRGCIFSDKGPAAFVDNDDEDEILAFLAIASTRVFKALVDTQLAAADAKPGGAARSYEVGLIQRTPIPSVDIESKRILKDLALKLWQLHQEDDICNETSRIFNRPFVLFESGFTVKGVACKLAERMAVREEKSKEWQQEIDDIGFSLYKIKSTDILDLLPTRRPESNTEQAEDWAEEAMEEEEQGQDNATFRVESERDIGVALVSWVLGVVFGRWDIPKTLLHEEQLRPFNPFSPLPLASPAALDSSIGFLNQDALSPEFNLRLDNHACIAWHGILVDDPQNQWDIDGCCNAAIAKIFPGSGYEIQQELNKLLSIPSLRHWFSYTGYFFSDHLGRYSRSRRQAPIYWQLSAGNGNFSAWLYYHRFTPDTLYRVLRDFVEPRIQEAEREQFELESQGGLLGDAASLLQKAQVLLQDLQLFKSELELVAPLWNPNLNDGVIINHAILWRITPYTPWQKKCKECWDKLLKGDYDWAHLAFHLWPERVIRKCITDRSLAIAHGLEERLWQETSKGNWLQRQVSEAELHALLSKYSKPAVQNALERFLAAPPPVASARTRAPRAAKSSSTGTTRRPRGSAPEVDAETSRQTLLVLTAAPAEGLGRNAIAELLAVEAASLAAVIKQLKEGGQIEQLGAARGAKYRLSESGLAAVESQAGEDN